MGKYDILKNETATGTFLQKVYDYLPNSGEMTTLVPGAAGCAAITGVALSILEAPAIIVAGGAVAMGIGAYVGGKAAVDYLRSPAPPKP